MASIDYPRFALVLRRCAEVAQDADAGSQVHAVYRDLLRAAAEPFLAAHDAAAAAEGAFEQRSSRFVEAMDALDAPYCGARAIVKEHFPDAGLPPSLVTLATLFDKATAIETLLNILDDSFVDESWAAKEVNGPFGRKAPVLVKELGEAVLADSVLRETHEARAVTYGPAYERHLLFKRVVRQEIGPYSGQYQSIHWRVAWDPEGAGPVSWGPFSFRAPLRTW